MKEQIASEHLYGDSLQKDTGLMRVLKTITHKPVRVLDKHMPGLVEGTEVIK